MTLHRQYYALGLLYDYYYGQYYADSRPGGQPKEDEE